MGKAKGFSRLTEIFYLYLKGDVKWGGAKPQWRGPPEGR
jgi:hypothetical protein